MESSMRTTLVNLCAFLAVAVPAQVPTSSATAIADADKAYVAHDWNAAESQYSALLRSQPENPRFYYRLGVAARANKHYDAALQAMEKAKLFGAGKGLPIFLADYEIALSHAGK